MKARILGHVAERRERRREIALRRHERRDVAAEATPEHAGPPGTEGARAAEAQVERRVAEGDRAHRRFERGDPLFLGVAEEGEGDVERGEVDPARGQGERADAVHGRAEAILDARVGIGGDEQAEGRHGECPSIPPDSSPDLWSCSSSARSNFSTPEALRWWKSRKSSRGSSATRSSNSQ